MKSRFGKPLKEFALAIPCFKKVNQTHPEDHTAQLFLNRSAKWLASGVEADWTEVEAPEGK